MLIPTDPLLSPTDFSSTDAPFVLKDRFYLLENNLEGRESIKDAEIFFLGHSPHRKNQSWIISSLILKLYGKGDVILCDPYENQASCSSVQGIVTPLKVHTWDPEKRKTQLEDKESLIHLLLHIEHIRKKGLSSPDWVEEIHELIDLFPSSENQDIMIHDTYSRKKLALLTTLQARLDCFNQLVISLSGEWERHLKELCNPYKVNTRIIHAIDQHSPRASRIFVLANIANITSKPFFNHVEGAEKAAETLFQYCSDKKYVVLYPNERDVDLPTLQEELQQPNLCNKMKNVFKSLSKKHKCRIGVAATLISPLIGLILASAGVLWVAYKVLSSCGNALCFKRDRFRESLEQQHLFFLMTLVILSAQDETLLPREKGMALVENIYANTCMLPYALKEEMSKHPSQVSLSLKGREIRYPLSPSSSVWSESSKPLPAQGGYNTFT